MDKPDDAALVARLAGCMDRIGLMCSRGHGPRMSVPVREDDDDIFIVETCKHAAARIEQLVSERDALWECVKAADDMCAHDSFYCRVYTTYEDARNTLAAIDAAIAGSGTGSGNAD